MKFLLAIFALIFSSGAIHAQTADDSENTKLIPVTVGPTISVTFGSGKKE